MMNSIKQIEACERELLTAILASDADVLDQLLHEDLIFNIPNGMTITKQMDLDNYRSGLMKVSEISTSDQVIQVIGDNGLVAVTIHLKGKYADHEIDSIFKYLRVWKRINNSWKVISGSGFQM